MESITISTSKKVEILDITDQVSTKVKSDAKVCILYVRHATAALTINEFEPNLKSDMEKLYPSLIPKSGWKHNAIDDNAEAHLLASLIKPSLSIPVEKGSLTLGTWQRILLVELDGPRNRTVNIQLL